MSIFWKNNDLLDDAISDDNESNKISTTKKNSKSEKKKKHEKSKMDECSTIDKSTCGKDRNSCEDQSCYDCPSRGFICSILCGIYKFIKFCVCCALTIFGCKKCSKKQVAIIRLSGIIAENGIGSRVLNFENIREHIDKAFNPRKYRAVALLINSPGGMPAQSEMIANYIIELSSQYKMQVYSFALDYAASGGYMIMCSGSELYATNTSIVGSIGVAMKGFGLEDAIAKLGIKRRIYAQGENKVIMDSFIPVKSNDEVIINEVQSDIYEYFTTYVKARRGDKLNINDPNIFSGMYWIGERAKSIGIIDNIGYYQTILKNKFGKDVYLHHINGPRKSWIRTIFSSNVEHNNVVNCFDSLINTFEWIIERMKLGI